VSSRLGIAIAICLVFVVLSVLGATMLRSALDDPAEIGFGGVEAVTAAAAPFEGLTETLLAVGDDCLHVVVADEPEERRDGLRGRTELGPYDAMLFVFPVDTEADFTMSGVEAPLDVGWYDAAGRPVDRTTMAPCPDGDDCPSYGSSQRYRYALETGPGALGGGALGACA